MIDVHAWKMPNGHKVTMMLEEAGLSYTLHPVNIGKGEQFRSDFLAIAPNNPIPAIVDNQPIDGGQPVSIFESGPILLYLAEKSGTMLPDAARERLEVVQWLSWQMAGLGSVMGQNLHFDRFAPEPTPYAIDRYLNETTCLFGILERRLRDQPFVAGCGYPVADTACYPWITLHEAAGQSLGEFAALQRWFGQVRSRPATARAYATAETM
ncbi:glutathione S-transferase N-terminal domain-containing protein [Xanthobacter sp. DSM 24535]|uniref:glutathione S-transferase N-terminal domain-containing protein n=1 Tax=Roseixanthobacter psychrophilus TaxID=3119917 RepID=UPI003726A3F6